MESYINNYSEVFTELSEIFKYVSGDILEKIPQSLKNEIERNKSREYNFVYDTKKSFEEQKFMDETKDLLSAIYLMYCCSKDEQKELIKICEENEKIYEELKNVKDINDIFEKKNVQDFSYCNIEPIKKDKWHVRVIKKIKEFIMKWR